MARLRLSKHLVAVVGLVLAAIALPAHAQQVADAAADVGVADPAFAKNAGPTVSIDSAHGEFQRLTSGYAPFAALLGNDGYRVGDFALPIAPQFLARTQVLVIADARNVDDPKGLAVDSTSAFTPGEIAVLRDWVESGGALLIVSDHPPFAGSVRALAAAFGFTINRFAARPREAGPELFNRANGGLVAGPLTAGVDQVQTFYGGSFRAEPGATPLLRLGPGWVMAEPGVDPAANPAATADDLRGAARMVGKGRVVLMAEAGELSAQIAGRGGPMGFNAPDATGNRRLVRNIIRWLATPAP